MVGLMFKLIFSKLHKTPRPVLATIQTRNMSSSENDVLFETINNKGIITINRPKLLNSATFPMVQSILKTLRSWESEKSMILAKGAGDKAFCAGGDVRSLVTDIMQGGNLAPLFFKEVYLNSGLVGAYKIPYIAFIDGLTIGGAFGMSVNGKYRVATERTVFAMPETRIGLFPDTGAIHFFSRLPNRLGYFLAMTGHRLKGIDVLKIGIATHFCESSTLKDLETDLIECKIEDIENILNKFCIRDPPGEFSLTPHLDTIKKCFTASTVEEVFTNLEKDGSQFALKTLQTLKEMSPTSLKITFRALDVEKTLNLHECLQLDYRIVYRCLKSHDFKEGVRALLIDKDLKPIWKPANITEVTDSLVNSHFEKLPEELELKNKL